MPVKARPIRNSARDLKQGVRKVRSEGQEARDAYVRARRETEQLLKSGLIGQIRRLPELESAIAAQAKVEQRVASRILRGMLAEGLLVRDASTGNFMLLKVSDFK